jgi:hypothetical protein
MKRKLTSLLVTMVLILSAAPALSAQEPKEPGGGSAAERDRLRKIMDPSADVEEFRRELDTFYSEMQASMNILLEGEFARDVAAGGGLDPLGQLAEARRKTPELTAQDLAVLKAAFARNPHWREIPERINALLNPDIREGLKRMRAPKPSAPVFSITAVMPSPISSLPGGIIHDKCDDAKVNGNPRVSNSDISVAQAFVIAGNAVMEALPTDGLTFEAHAAAGVLLAALDATVLTLETFKNISDDCSDTDFQNYVTANLDEQVSTRSSQTSVNNVQTTANSIEHKLDDRLDVKVSSRASQDSVNTVQQGVNLANSKLDLANGKLDHLLANLASFQAQSLRLQIEGNMANGTNDAAVGLFALPAAQGGFLELARSILVETIQNAQATGQGIGNAQTFLNQGDQQRAAGRFKDAYDSYRQAYSTATGH